MYPTLGDALVIAKGVKRALEDIHHVEVVLCPPAVMIPLVHEIIADHKLSHLHLGAQNMHWQESGPLTGEISANMVKGFAQYVIVGHSERVKWFHETPHETNQKIQAALRHGLIPIVCVGELKKHEKAYEEVLDKLQQILKDIDKDDYQKLIIIYEPVWAISSGNPYASQAATGEYAQEVSSEIRKLVGLHTRILYGGSTNAENLAEFLHQEDIDGALVGGASVKLQEFIKMCEIASETRSHGS